MAESLHSLRLEVAELRASRKRLVQAADAERRAIERELHDGAQQHLVAVAVNLQHARRAIDDDPAAAKKLLEETGRDVQQALDETRKLAHRIFPPLAGPNDLRSALRFAATDAGVAPQIVMVEEPHDPDLAAAVYFFAVAVFTGETASIRVERDAGEVVFEIVGSSAADEKLALARERFEALGGQLEVEGACVRGRLSCSRRGTGSPL